MPYCDFPCVASAGRCLLMVPAINVPITGEVKERAWALTQLTCTIMLARALFVVAR